MAVYDAGGVCAAIKLQESILNGVFEVACAIDGGSNGVREGQCGTVSLIQSCVSEPEYGVCDCRRRC